MKPIVKLALVSVLVVFVLVLGTWFVMLYKDNTQPRSYTFNPSDFTTFDNVQLIRTRNRIAIKELPHLTEDNTWLEPGETITIEGYDPKSKFYKISYEQETRFVFYSMLALALPNTTE